MLGTTILYLLRSFFSLFLQLRRRIDRFVYYPSETCSLASCTTTFCLCKSCQRTLSSCPLPSGVCHRFSESECKGTAFSRHGKIFHGLFSKKSFISENLTTKTEEQTPCLENLSGTCHQIQYYLLNI